MFKICVDIPNLSEKHKATLEAICDYILSNRQSPTVREIADMTGRSLVCTYVSLDVLRKKGFVNWQKKRSRTISVFLDKLPV